MCKMTINLNSIDKVKEFIKIISQYEDDFNLITNSHSIVDAKSIMGILSLDLSKPIIIVSETARQDVMEIALMKFKRKT